MSREPDCYGLIKIKNNAKCCYLFILSPFDQHYGPMIPPTEGRKVTLRLLGQISKIMTHFAKFFNKNAHFISTDDKIVYIYFFGKLQILLNQGFPRPISLRSGCFVGKIGLGNSW